MAYLPTAAARAATARRRSRRTSTVVRDPCPLCGADLGGTHHATRRQVVFSPVPGCFRWRCPDCQGVWEQRVAPRSAPE